MKILTIDSKPLFDFLLRNYQLGDMGSYLYSLKTAEEVISVLLGKIPKEIDWEYPEQVLSTKQQCYVSDIINKLDIPINILTTSSVFLSRIKFDEKYQAVNNEKYTINYGYGNKLDALWEYQQ